MIRVRVVAVDAAVGGGTVAEEIVADDRPDTRRCRERPITIDLNAGIPIAQRGVAAKGFGRCAVVWIQIDLETNLPARHA